MFEKEKCFLNEKKVVYQCQLQQERHLINATSSTVTTIDFEQETRH